MDGLSQPVRLLVWFVAFPYLGWLLVRRRDVLLVEPT
jgi:hypothetical protein